MFYLDWRDKLLANHFCDSKCVSDFQTSLNAKLELYQISFTLPGWVLIVSFTTDISTTSVQLDNESALSATSSAVITSQLKKIMDLMSLPFSSAIKLITDKKVEYVNLELFKGWTIEEEFHHTLPGTLYKQQQQPSFYGDSLLKTMLSLAIVNIDNFRVATKKISTSLVPKSSIPFNYKEFPAAKAQHIWNNMVELQQRHLQLPLKLVGRLIGRGGRRIQEIRQKTRARILIHDSKTQTHSPAFKTYLTLVPTQLVTIVGSDADISCALELISQLSR